jgi:glycosyltransferase involved in cell wall biosynthesis
MSPNGHAAEAAGTRPPRRALHLVYSHYASDPRTRRQAEALRDAGWEVTVRCLAREGEPPRTSLDGVAVRATYVPRYRGRSLVRYLRSYGQFLAGAAAEIAAHPRRYDFVHVHSLPDFAVHAAHPARWSGAGVVLDIHDLVPELFIERFGTDRAWALRLAKFSERLSCASATHVLTANEQFRERLVARGIPAEKISLNLNLPDERVFWRDDPPAPPQTPVLAYHGTLVPRYGPDLLLEAAARLIPRFPSLTVRIVGDGDQREELVRRAGQPDLAGRVWMSPDRVPIHGIPDALGQVSVGVVANRPDSFSRLVLPTKLLEYLALGIPAVVTRTETTDYYFQPGELTTVERPDADSLADAIAPLLADPAEARRRLENARRFFTRHAWERERAEYVALAERLARRTTPASAVPG